MDERWRASHILIPFRGAKGAKSSALKAKKALKFINDLLAQIQAGADFAELARAHSTCSSRSKGGDLGEFGPGQMVPAFERATAILAIGAVTPEPVETPFGYHLIRRTG